MVYDDAVDADVFERVADVADVGFVGYVGCACSSGYVGDVAYAVFVVDMLLKLLQWCLC
jgi:hypothetical protein